LAVLWIEIWHCENYSWYTMESIDHSFPVLKAPWGFQVKGQHMRAWLAEYLKEVLDHFELTDGHLVRIATHNASSTYSMTHKFQATLEVFGIQLTALRFHIPRLPHVVQLALGAFMSSLGVKGRTKSWKAHGRN
jgi:hypothetical protein